MDTDEETGGSGVPGGHDEVLRLLIELRPHHLRFETLKRITWIRGNTIFFGLCII